MQANNITSIYGSILVEDADGKNNRLYVVEASRRQISLSKALCTGPSSLWISTSDPTLNSSSAIQSLLQLARPYVRKAKELRTRASIGAQELEQIEARAQAEERPLPTDFSYDGKYYVDFYGTRLSQRPDMEELIGDYLNEVNSQTASKNVKRGLQHS